jgi:hypothetical protein
MDVNLKRSAALELLAETGMWPISYAPPLFRLLWRLGIDVPPPHFAGFWANFVLSGSLFGVAMGLYQWFFNTPRSLTLALVATVFCGVFFGLSMAVRYRNGARKYNIPSWQAFQPSSVHKAPSSSQLQP